MYSAAIQRYFNEHIHLPYSFFLQPQRFIRHALKKKGAFMATAYNYVEPSEADNEDIIEYLATDFDVMAGNTAGRLCVLMKIPEPTMPLHCKMIGCSIKRDGSNPIWRTIELTEQGTLLLCGWGEGHTHKSDCAEDYPGVFIDFVREDGATVVLACVEYDPDKDLLQTVVYGDCASDEPTAIVEHYNTDFEE